MRRHASMEPFMARAEQEGYGLHISTLTLAEIESGQSMNSLTNRQEANFLLSKFETIAVNDGIAQRAGEMRRIYGIEIIDALIAATALSVNATLVTRNIKHFEGIPELEIKTLA
ncbi:MAG: PIN domain-containing protein [Parcubacteria group bacterium]|nr:PIN domain-containing protein [Parcubacteria group bacterium]